jgi:hypothetical protein
MEVEYDTHRPEIIKEPNLSLSTVLSKKRGINKGKEDELRFHQEMDTESCHFSHK